MVLLKGRAMFDGRRQLSRIARGGMRHRINAKTHRPTAPPPNRRPHNPRKPQIPYNKPGPSTSSNGPTAGGASRGEAGRRYLELQALLARLKAAEIRIVWDRRTVIILVAGGTIFGAVGLGGLITWYVNRHPETLEQLVTAFAVQAFSKALTFDAKKSIYLKLPDPPHMPTSAFHTQFLSVIAEGLGDGEELDALSAERRLLLGWANLVEQGLHKISSSWLVNAKREMRHVLEQEINQRDQLEDRLQLIQELWGPSAERNLQVQQQLQEAGDWIPASVLEDNIPQEPAEPHEQCTKLLIAALSYFPGPINQLIKCLDGTTTAPDTAQALALSESDEEQQQMCAVLLNLQHQFSQLPNEMRQFVLHAGVTAAVHNLSSPILAKALATVPWARHGLQGPSPYSLYKKAIDNDLLGPLRRDARISERVLSLVKAVFLALPATIQARILLKAISHPYANDQNATPAQQASIVKDLMEAGGVVSVKLAQMIAEDPRVPKEYRSLLGDLRETNTPMSTGAFWGSIPQQLRSHIKQLGGCLGTGSVKQVHKVVFLADGFLPSQQTEDGLPLPPCAVAVLRQNVEDEAMSSLSALHASDDLAPIASKLGRLVYREFNLFEEGEALSEFAATSIGQHPSFRVVKVLHHSPKCLVEDVAQGQTVARMLKGYTEETQVEFKGTLELLTQYHHAVFDAFVHDGIIHSDIHLGNAVQGPVGDLQPPAQGFTLFDVGQFERIGPADTKAILWALSWVTKTLEGGLDLRKIALSHLVSVSTLQDQLLPLSAKEANKLLEHRISAAFEEAIKPDEDGAKPDKKTAYMLLLRNAEALHVALPKGAFAVAKMIDGIISQQASYGLPQVLDESITKFLKSNMTWAETFSLTSTAVGSVMGSTVGRGNVNNKKVQKADPTL